MKRVFYRKILMMALLCALTPGVLAEAVAAAPDAGTRAELNLRLDSLAVEKQTRKRQGLPIGELEELAARMRDTIETMRAAAPPAALDETAADGYRFPDWLPIPQTLAGFRPRGAFDWIVVGTGGVAILSLLTLIIGLVIGRKKKSAEPKKKSGNRRINLAPTGTIPAAPTIPDLRRFTQPDTRGGDAEMIPGGMDPLGGLQSLMENLRQIAPPPEPEPSAAPEPPPPLIVNAPEDLPEPVRTPTVTMNAAAPNFNELVIAAAKTGLNEQEISRRYQLSVDQVRLILRMNKNP